jgi:hypothetical protein
MRFVRHLRVREGDICCVAGLAGRAMQGRDDVGAQRSGGLSNAQRGRIAGLRIESVAVEPERGFVGWERVDERRDER